MQNRIRHILAGDREAGFTLIELLIAVTIFAIGLLAVASMQLSAISGNKLGAEWTRATELAQMQIEALKNGDITTAAYNADVYNDPNNPINETGASGGIYTRSWQVADNTTFTKRVTVTVSWTQAGRTHSVALTTVTKGGGI